MLDVEVLEVINWVHFHFKMWSEILVNLSLSLVGYYTILKIVPKLKDMFLKANISGTDLNKVEKLTM